jgi:myo-inositol-1(or 4)-monophosphatase
VSVAAEMDGAVVAGVVVEPWRGEVFRAVAGGGATLDGRPIRVNPAVDPATSLVATGFSYRAEQRALQARALTHLLPRVRDIRRVGSAALDLCDVACGRVDAYYEWDVNPWDVAAGSLIAAEAGATVSALDGRGAPGDGGGAVAAPASLHHAFVTLLTEAMRVATDTLPGSSSALR